MWLLRPGGKAHGLLPALSLELLALEKASFHVMKIPKQPSRKRGVCGRKQVSSLWPHSCCCFLDVSDSLQPHGLQHARPSCPSPSPRVCPSSCSLHQWCHPAISSSEALFFFCSQSFLASGTFPMSCLFASDDQNTRASALTSVLPVNIQGLSSLRLTGLILLSKEVSGVFFSPSVWRHQFVGILHSLWYRSHNHTWALGCHVVKPSQKWKFLPSAIYWRQRTF